MLFTYGIVIHPYDKKACMAFAKKRPILSAEKAIFATIPPHLTFGHKKFNTKKNQPNNITTLLALIFYFYFI
jgi:hypothetical protein